MPRIAPEKLMPGMKLAKPVLNKAGIVLLGEGTELSETWVRRIQDMELVNVCVEGPNLPKTSKEEALAQLDERFKKVLDKPHMAMLKKVIQRHIEGLYE